MWIVMSVSASVPASWHGFYRCVCLVRLSQEYTAKNLKPKMACDRAIGVLEAHRSVPLRVGKTDRSEYARGLAYAKRIADELNNSAPEAAADLLTTWGGSA